MPPSLGTLPNASEPSPPGAGPTDPTDEASPPHGLHCAAEDPVTPEPLPYHRATVEHLRAALPEAWAHYASHQSVDAHEDAVRLHLLQTTYRMTPESHPELHQEVAEVASILGLSLPVELYHHTEPGASNASLIFHPERLRLTFQGPILELLNTDERKAMVAHELAHHLLWTAEDGAFYVADRLLHGVHRQGRSAFHSLRLFQLHTESFCDQAALVLLPKEPVIATLVKITTGLKQVSATDFLAQSEELYAADGGAGSAGWTHPEAHLRALAVAHSTTGAGPTTRRLLEGPVDLETLDLLRRAELTTVTRHLLGHVFQPSWLRTNAQLGLLRILFDDDLPAFEAWSIEPALALADYGTSVCDYLVALLVDVTAADPALEQLPMLRCHQVAEWLGLADDFEKAVNRQLKMRRKDITIALVDRDDTLAAAQEAAEAAEAAEATATDDPPTEPSP